MWDWLDGLASLNIGADIIAFLNYLLQVLVAVFEFLYTLLAAVFNFLWALLVKVGDFFKTLWTGFFKKIFQGFFHAILKVHDWLEAKLGPVIRFLQKMRAYIDRWYRLYIKPILNMIQSVRKFLEILRLFGIKWAAALDARLAQVENDINQVFATVRGIINGFIDILNAIADPMGLLRRPTLILSLRRTFNALVRLHTGLPPAYFFPSPRSTAAVGLGRLPLNFNAADPAMNPPASYYLSQDDGLGSFNGFLAGEVPDDSEIDDADPLDAFDPTLYPAPDCIDAAACMQQAWQQQFSLVALQRTA